ncbi:universal stress protein [Haloarchaeobius salinus]|uniref:universal stress protein n=1 Tax=Haloarchaeobius salinus TaxID=1198298 RepID=UPI00210A93AA|nr:universal stress protein [Haloarchaeobius salinus]
MARYQSILVATDGSETAGRAVDHAVSLASDADDMVYVLSVAHSRESPMSFGVETLEGIEAAVERTAAEVGEHLGEAAVSGMVRRGRPDDQILAAADEVGADMIVLGRTGSSGLADRVLGGTADRVVRRSKRPVLLIPETGAT